MTTTNNHDFQPARFTGNLSDSTRAELERAFGDQFMSWFIHGPLDWVETEDIFGESSLLPLDDWDRDLAAVRTLEIHRGKYSARLSANGYMDATDYVGVFDTAEEAARALLAAYGNEDEDAY